jgi:hypothetical protein
VADAMLAEVPSATAGVAVLHTEGFAERELAGMLAYRLRRSKHPALLVEAARADPGARRALIDDLVAKRPGAILLAASATAPARALLADLATRLPSVRVVASQQLATRRANRVPAGAEAITGVLPPRVQPAGGRRLLRSLGRRRAEALYGYDAMGLVLDAIDGGGPDRRKVVAAALAPRRRSGVTGRYAVRGDGTVAGRRLAVVDLGRDRVSLRRGSP